MLTVTRPGPLFSDTSVGRGNSSSGVDTMTRVRQMYITLGCQLFAFCGPIVQLLDLARRDTIPEFLQTSLPRFYFHSERVAKQRAFVTHIAELLLLQPIDALTLTQRDLLLVQSGVVPHRDGAEEDAVKAI